MKYNNILKFAIAAVLSLGAVSCAREKFEEISELDLARCLEPMNLDAKVNAILGDVVTFSWDVAKDAQTYLLNIYTDAAQTNVYSSVTLEPSQVPYTVKLEADATYYFTVQAQNEKKIDSKVAVYDKSVKTYAVKDNLYLKLTDRTSTSVSLAWSKEVADFEDVDRVVTRRPGDETTETTHTLTADEIAAAAVTINDLAPGYEYEFILYFKSASRGQVNAWTAASTEGATEVSTLEGLLNAIKTQGARIYLKLEGSPYDIEALDLTNGFSLMGEMDVDGNIPVLTGELHIADAWAGENLAFENIAFDGAPTAASPSGFGFAIQNKNGGTVKGKNIGSITYTNCVITNYTKGLIYEWGNEMVLGDVTYDSCEITNINVDGTVGGDVFDIRQATSIQSLTFTNNTIAQGMRTFVRIDAGELGKLVFENNTLYNLCFVDNTNNAGIFGLQIVPGEFVFKKNLFLNMTGKATLESANTKYKTASDMAVAASDNYFWSLPVGDDGSVTFFTDNFTQAQAGGTILEDSPCYNAAGGFFNIQATSDIAGKNIGASKWWTPFVEEPEDLTMTIVPQPHTWNLGNARYFAGTIKKEMVRDYLFVSGSETTPIVAANGMLAFESPVVTNRAGVPQFNYVAFHTDKPGSLVIKAENPADFTGHLVVGVGPVDGTSIALKGGVSALAEQENTTKILITSITEESIVYIYPSGPVSLSKLSWTADVTPVNTALQTPEPSADPSSFTAGEAKDVVISWEPVENAESYSVVFSGKTYNVEECSYTIEGKTTSMLDAGSYTVSVYANPGASDIYNTESAAGVAAFAVLPAGGGEGGDEFVVASVEDLMSAIDAGKDYITLKYSDAVYEVGKVTLNAPLHLKGQTSGDKKTAINASFTLSGEIGGSVVLSNLDITSSDAGSAVSVLIDDKTAAPVADTVAIYDSNLHGTKALYDNSGKAESNVQWVIFKGNLITDSSDGADYIDMRAGAHHNFVFENNTVANSCRTFVRTDAAHEMNTAAIRNNTFYKVATNSSSKDNNGILHIRSAAGAGLYDYRVENNFFYSILIDPSNLPSNANGFPKFKSGGGVVPSVIRNNYFYNCEETLADYSFWKNLSKEDATAQGGAILPSDPCKDAANGDFTLTNAVMMNAGVGDPRWNSMAGSTPASEITVEDADALLTAISAGKKVITLADGTYNLGTAAVELASPLTLQGGKDAVVTGKFQLGTGATQFTVRGITLDGKGSLDAALDNAFYVADGAQVTSAQLLDVQVKNYGNRLFYQDKATSSVGSLVISGALITNMGTSGDFIDFRNGTLNALKVVNSTFANGIRTFARIDANVVCGSILVQNNTFYNLSYVDSKDNNGIFHVRSSSVTSAGQVVVKDNLFAHMQRAAEAPSNAQGFPKLVSKASSAIAVPSFSHNYFAEVLSTENDTDAEFSWWAYSAKDVATAGYGVVLTADVFKDAASGDFTVIHDLVASEKVGDPRWIPAGAPSAETFAVNDVEGLMSALSAGKASISLNAGTYDLSKVEAGAVITLEKGVTLKGVTRNGVKPELVGGFILKLAGAESFVLENLRLNGAYTAADGDKKVGNMIDIDASTLMGAIELKDCEIYGFNNRLVSQAGESAVGSLTLTGNLVHDFGTSGDFIDFRKGMLNLVNVKNNTFYNGIRTFLRIDAAVTTGAVTVENNTFFNLCSVDSKDNNGIMHVRSTSSVAPASLGAAARRILVTRNIFASMHKAAAEPGNPAGFPKLVSTASEKIAHPYITDNIFFDLDTAEPYSWWNTMVAEDIEAAGKVVEETPFSADPATGKFTVKTAYKGYGDGRW